MKKVILRIATVVLAMVVAVTSIGVAVAQEDPEEIQPQELVPVLAVEVPRVAQVGQLVTITVKERGGGEVVEGASVYAWGWPLRSTSHAHSLIAPESFYFQLLGETNGSGEVSHTFERPGKFIIVATMEGYVPGLARLVVKVDLVGKLEIEAPRRVEINQPVTIKVVEKKSGEGVSEADVWAIRLPMRVLDDAAIPSMSDVRGLLGGVKDQGNGRITEVLTKFGEHLGQTDDDGILTTTFTEVGRYLLVSTKSEYMPGVKPIAVVADKALAIKAPRRVGVNEDVTFTVTTRGMGTPVEGVELYALGMPFVGSLHMSLPNLDAAGVASLKELVVDNGTYLGMTDYDGEVKDYEFAEAGIYLIVGIKDGYVPGVTIIRVGQFRGFKQILPQFQGFREGIGGHL